MDLRSAFSRAKRGFRDDLRLHVVAVASLVIAFLCLGAALLSVENLGRVAERWSGVRHLTIYLKDGAAPSDVAQLRLVLESLQETRSVRHVTADQARTEFAQQVDLGGSAASLPADAFPASLEVVLTPETTEARIAKVAERVRQFGAVEEVETYKDWLAQMGALMSAGKSAVLLLSILVTVCVLAIIGNTIRLAVANRRREIEVLKLCGATDGFVASPFLLEGVMQAVAAAVIAMLALMALYFAVRGQLEATLAAVTGVRTAFLQPTTALAIVLGGGTAGAVGSALSLRRYLRV